MHFDLRRSSWNHSGCPIEGHILEKVVPILPFPNFGRCCSSSFPWRSGDTHGHCHSGLQWDRKPPYKSWQEATHPPDRCLSATYSWRVSMSSVTKTNAFRNVGWMDNSVQGCFLKQLGTISWFLFKSSVPLRTRTVIEAVALCTL